MADVVYMISDMLFSSKLREAAKASGVTVQAQRDAAAWAAAAASDAKLAIVDLRMPTALAALDALAVAHAPANLRVVGFIDHERVEVMDQAHAKGCTDVMAKGQFANALPKLLAGLSTPA